MLLNSSKIIAILCVHCFPNSIRISKYFEHSEFEFSRFYTSVISWQGHIYEQRHEIFNNVVCGTSLSIHAVWSEPLLVTWVFYEFYATDWTSFEVSKLKRRLHRLVWVYTCQNATLLEITCHGSYIMLKWESSWYFGTYCTCEQRRFRWCLS